MYSKLLKIVVIVAIVVFGGVVLKPASSKQPSKQPWQSAPGPANPNGRPAATYTPAVEDGPAHNGVEVAIDLPPAQQIKNIGAPKDGLGLCVFASMEHAARWHNRRGLFDVIHRVPYGGGWPEKVDEVLKSVDPSSHVVHYLGSDPSFLDKEIAQGKIVCITYGYSERYNNGLATIYHMVNLVHLDQNWGVVLDNNFPCTPGNPNRYEWMSRAELLRRWVHPHGQGWAYTFVAPPPPPVPHSAKYRKAS